MLSFHMVQNFAVNLNRFLYPAKARIILLVDLRTLLL